MSEEIKNELIGISVILLFGWVCFIALVVKMTEDTIGAAVIIGLGYLLTRMRAWVSVTSIKADALNLNAAATTMFNSAKETIEGLQTELAKERNRT